MLGICRLERLGDEQPLQSADWVVGDGLPSQRKKERKQSTLPLRLLALFFLHFNPPAKEIARMIPLRNYLHRITLFAAPPRVAPP